MNNNLTELVYILDKSGSMYHLTADTIGGYNSMIAEQKKQPGDANVTTVLFDSKHMTIVENENIQNVKDMTSSDYVPGGGTAMLDAIGDTIISIGRKLAAMSEEERPGKVIVTIVTDGAENSSMDYSYRDIKKMIQEQRNKYSWIFIFIGANIDAGEIGGCMGIDPMLVKGYTANQVGTQSLYKSVSSATSMSRGLSARGVNATDEYVKAMSVALDKIQ